MNGALLHANQSVDCSDRYKYLCRWIAAGQWGLWRPSSISLSRDISLYRGDRVQLIWHVREIVSVFMKKSNVLHRFLSGNKIYIVLCGVEKHRQKIVVFHNNSSWDRWDKPTIEQGDGLNLLTVLFHRRNLCWVIRRLQSIIK